MSSSPSLRLAWCSEAAARYAVEHWHYSHTMPARKYVHIGVWEDDAFIGVVMFSIGGGNATNGVRFGLAKRFEVAELARVALTKHRTPVSRIVAIAIRMLRRQSPKLRLIVSFADPRFGHVGGIYQAGGWVYDGQSAANRVFVDKRGREWHSRVVSPSGYRLQFGNYKRVPKPEECTVVVVPGKYRYLMPLDDEMRERILPLAKPYPKQAPEASSDTPATHAGEGGVAPTPALHTSPRQSTR